MPQLWAEHPLLASIMPCVQRDHSARRAARSHDMVEGPSDPTAEK